MPEQLSFLTNILPNLLTALLIFAVSYIVGVWLSRLLVRVLKHQNADPERHDSGSALQ